jgi:hypothetical protein
VTAEQSPLHFSDKKNLEHCDLNQKGTMCFVSGVGVEFSVCIFCIPEDNPLMATRWY